MTSFPWRLAPLALLISTVACDGGTEPPADAGAPDAAVTDSAVADSAVVDAGPLPDEIVVEERDGSFICHPVGAGPFPGVVYNHGGLNDMVGGDLRGTCVALAEAGYVGYAKLRRATMTLAGHLDDVFEALDELLLMSDVDPTRIGMVGFSRGGLLALQAATMRSELDAIVLMAPAPGNGALDATLADAALVTSSVLVLVAENDMNAMVDHVALTAQVETELRAAGVEVERRVLAAFLEEPQPGHSLFFEVRPEYWPLVIEFLDAQL